MHLTFETADLHYIFDTSRGDDFQVDFDKLFLYAPIVIPDAQGQIMFKDSIRKNLTSSFDSWSTDR